jgi:glycosyltransferase involved in cell wall biosynthesis
MTSNKLSPLVSIIMPALNAGKTISESIESVLAQSYSNWELIVVDDGSTDDTLITITNYKEKDSRIKVLSTTGRTGPANARNMGIDVATGRYCAFLDSDDLWSKEKLSRQIKFMQENNIYISFTAYRKIDADGQISENFVQVPKYVNYNDILKSNSIGCLTAIFDLEEFPGARMPDLGVREDLRFWLSLLKQERIGHEDYGFWLSLLRNRRRKYLAYGINEPLAFYRIGHSSLSSNKKKAAIYQWLVYRKLEEMSFLRSIYYFSIYAVKGFLKSRVR